jgi:hypothetical protein
MSRVRSTKSSQRELIAHLKSESASLAEFIELRRRELEEAEEKKFRIDATISSYEPPKSKSAVVTRARSTERPKTDDVATEVFFAGLSLQEAARKQLAFVKKPQTPQEIWPVLSAAGFVSASERPSNAVHWSLRKREKTHGDVLLIGRGQWALPEWYTPEQRAEIEKNLGGMAGRNSAAHSEKTKLGMKLSQKRGVRIGAPKKIDDAMIERLRAHIAAGDSIVAACKKEKISAGSFQVLRSKGVTGLDRLTGAARKKAIQKAKSWQGLVAPDLLSATQNDEPSPVSDEPKLRVVR